MQEINQFVDDLELALLSLDQEKSKEVICKAMEHGSVIDIASRLITEALERIGEGWEKGEYSLSQVYMSGVFCERIIDELLPPESPKRRAQPTTAIGVFEDYHMLGKRIVYSSLRAGGAEIIDLGGGLTVDKTIELVKEKKIKILLLSVLMLPSALRIKGLVDALKGEDVKIIVGGAPFRFDTSLADEIGVYAFGKDSADAIKIVNRIMEDVK